MSKISSLKNCMILIIIVILLSGCSSEKDKYCWSIYKLNINKAWNLSKGSNQTIAFVDTGISKELYNEYKKRIVSPRNVIYDNTDVFDKLGHGTEMIEAASASGYRGVWGVAPESKIMPILAFQKNGLTKPKYVAKGIMWAINHRADIINLSLGSPIKDSDVEKKIIEANKKGIVVVASAGDYGNAELLFPANMMEVISVEAQGVDGKLLDTSNHSKEATIIAPGEKISVLSLDQGGKLVTQKATGTSVSTSIISGLIALKLDYTPKIYLKELKHAIKNSVSEDNYLDSLKFLKYKM